MTREFKNLVKANVMTRVLKYNYEAEDDDFLKVKIKKRKQFLLRLSES
jgi:hypothetical protein